MRKDFSDCRTFKGVNMKVNWKFKVGALEPFSLGSVRNYYFNFALLGLKYIVWGAQFPLYRVCSRGPGGGGGGERGP